MARNITPELLFVRSSKRFSFLHARGENPHGDQKGALHGICSPLMFGKPNNQGAEIGEILLSQMKRSKIPTHLEMQTGIDFS